LENFLLDYTGGYPGLPSGVIEYQYIEGERASFFTEDNRQIGSTETMDNAAKQILGSLGTIIQNQQDRLAAASPDEGGEQPAPEPIVIDPTQPLDVSLFDSADPFVKALMKSRLVGAANSGLVSKSGVITYVLLC
jgi:hypothetical protein